MQWNRRHGVKLLVARQRVSQQIAERARQGFDLAVFVLVDQLAQDALVGAKTIGLIKAAMPAAAQGAAAAGIQRERVLKRRSASGAEVFGGERLRRL